VLAAVEGGGTSWVVALAHAPTEPPLERETFATSDDPKETLSAVAQWLSERKYDALGVATFGPVDLDPASSTYGYITTTPKKGWRHTDVLGPLRAVRPSVPCAFDTDVNAPALAEFREARREGRVRSSMAYITVGTGIGVGLVVNGRPVHGALHPEGGHLAVPRLASDAAFDGSNPHDTFGGTCAENMACSKSLVLRANLSDVSQLATLPDSHPVWDAAAHYLGALCANIVLLVSPERIVLSGGVMQRGILFSKIQSATLAHLNGYLKLDALTEEGIGDFVPPSPHGNDAGLVGALTLAHFALHRPNEDDDAYPEREQVPKSSFGFLLPTLGAAAVGFGLGVLAARWR
jgi:fructokinase